MPYILAALAAIVIFAFLSLLFLLSLKGTLTVAYDKELYVSFRVLCFKIVLYPVKPKKKRYRHRMSRRQAAKIRKAAEKRESSKSWLREKLIGLFKRKPKEEADEEEKKEEKKEDATSDVKPKLPPIGKTASFVIDIVASIATAVAIIVKRFSHHLRIKVARLHVTVAGEDASVTAVTYGAVTQIVNIMLPILSSVKNFKLPRQKDFDISVDFSATTPEIDAEISFSLRVWHFADIGLRALFGGIVKFFKRNDSLEDVLSWALGLIFDGLKKKDTQEAEPKTENN